jgi:predicted RNA-binding protein with PIN domain
MLYLIDGYNLLHAMGLLRKRVGPQGLAKARLGLLGLIGGAMGTTASSVTVVFDAVNAPPDTQDHQEHLGIQVRFAIDQDQADDLIESMIRESSAPKQLTVVSDDRRLRNAARKRKCLSVGCLDFLDDLARHRKRRRSSPVSHSDKKGTSKLESEFWLQEFRHLDDEVDMKELFQKFDFEEE